MNYIGLIRGIHDKYGEGWDMLNFVLYVKISVFLEKQIDFHRAFLKM
jgi:hypothetical protein